MIDFSNASVFKLKKTDASKFDSEMHDILIEDEKIIGCYQDVRDHVVFTNKRVIAVQRFDKKRKLENGETEFPFEVYANIRIVWASEDVELGGEGCLSVPDRNGDVLRSKEITIEYTDYSSKNAGKKLPVVRETVKGFTAVIFQHEIDHLEGVLYIDRL